MRGKQVELGCDSLNETRGFALKTNSALKIKYVEYQKLKATEINIDRSCLDTEINKYKKFKELDFGLTFKSVNQLEEFIEAMTNARYEIVKNIEKLKTV